MQAPPTAWKTELCLGVSLGGPGYMREPTFRRSEVFSSCSNVSFYPSRSRSLLHAIASIDEEAGSIQMAA